jgi:hypothetical protein
MSARPALPPPPPPPHIRSWPDRAALLADRAGILGYLAKRSLGAGALVIFWLLVAGAQLGWGMIGSALVSLSGGSGMFVDAVVAFLGTVGVGFLLAAAAVLVLLVRRDQRVRELMAQWGALDSDPVADRRFRLPGLSLWWLLTSFLAGAFGLWIAFAVPAGARAGEDTYAGVAYAMGAGTILWIAALIGASRAVRHFRWALRLGAVPRAPVGPPLSSGPASAARP